MDQRGWSINKLSEESGVLNAGLNNYLRHGKSYTDENIVKVLETLDIILITKVDFASYLDDFTEVVNELNTEIEKLKENN